MKYRRSLLVALLAVSFSAVVSAYAQHEGHDHAAAKPKVPMTMTIEGRLIDLGCYAMGMSGGDKHVRCAANCAEKGLPVGLRATEGGKIYTVVLPSPKLVDYMEKEVRITGKVLATNLLSPEKLEIKTGNTWKSVEVPSDM